MRGTKSLVLFRENAKEKDIILSVTYVTYPAVTLTNLIRLIDILTGM